MLRFTHFQSKISLKKIFPYILLVSLIVFLCIFVVITKKDYGITWDEPLQNLYGKIILSWYHTHGKNTIFLATTNIRYYGPAFEVSVALIQNYFAKSLHDPWIIRNLCTAFFGILGIIGVALCGIEIGGSWVGFLAALFLTLTPRYFGDMFGNSKDLPVAVMGTFILWILLKLSRNIKRKRSILYAIVGGIFIGIAIAIRVVAIMWLPIYAIVCIYAFILLFFKKDWLDLKRYAIFSVISGCIIAITSTTLTVILWPFVYLDPVKNFLEAYSVMAHFIAPPSATNLINGIFIPYLQMPWYYTLEWIGITTPLVILFFLFVSIGISIYLIVIKKDYENRIYIVLFSLIFPLLVIILLHSVLYNGLRQILFVTPPIALLAAYAVIYCIEHISLWRKYLIGGICVVLVFGGFLILKEMVILHPYEYIYFNELVGNLHGANGKFDTDYWGASYKACAQGLGSIYQNYVSTNPPSVQLETTDIIQIYHFLPQSFVINTTNPDFYITLVEHRSGSFEYLYPSYHVIYTVKREGVVLCEVKSMHTKFH